MKKNETDWLAQMDAGRAYLSEGNYQAAEAIFKKLMVATKDPIARNNYAVSRYAQEDWKRTLEILEPNLQTDVMNPYARALAAKAWLKLGRNDLAEKLLNQAVIQFEWGASKAIDGWFDYLTIIAETAGLLLKHRQVVELHQKWSHCYQNLENYIYAGTAYFNLGRYKQAIGAWTKVARQYNYLEYFILVTQKIESGIIPPFPLEYTRIPLPESLDMQWVEANCGHGLVKMYTLGFIFENQHEKKQAIDGVLSLLIKHSGDWGEKLAGEILRSNSLDMSFKMAVGRVLYELGDVPEEGIPMRIDGKVQLVKIEKLEVIPKNDRYDIVIKQAVQLIRGKEYDRAEVLVNSVMEKGVFYPPATEILVRINVLKGKFSEAANLLESLLQLAPENSFYRLMMAELQLRKGDLGQAGKYLAMVQPEDLPDELRDSYDKMARALNHDELVDLGAVYKDRLWQDALEKPLPRKPTLQSCLKRIPVEWVTGICLNLGLEPETRRPNREVQIVEFFQDRAMVSKLIRNLSTSAQSLLRLILEKEGRLKLGAITRQFGSVSEDSFYWTEEEPETPLGQLLSCGLAFAGTMSDENGRRYKMVVIPDDSLERLRSTPVE